MTQTRDTALIRRGMVLAAGLGVRMRPITLTTPKPLVAVAGRTLIDRAIDRLDEVGVETVVVNVFHLGEKIATHLRKRDTPRLVISRESERLETGGGVMHALEYFEGAPFYVVNGDALILNGTQPALRVLASLWDEDRMDGLLLVHPAPEAYGYDGVGDFRMDPLGTLTRRPEREIAPYTFTGVQILHPRLFDGAPAGAFSLNVLYDRAISQGRLFGAVHDGKYFHVGTPGDLGVVEHYLSLMHSGVRRT